jgi:hypothetical protein
VFVTKESINSIIQANMTKSNSMITLLGLLGLSLITQVQAANCGGSHITAWGTITWSEINDAIALVCNADPVNEDLTEVAALDGYNIASGRAVVGSGGSPNCWTAMYQIRDQCLDTGNGHYATQGWWKLGDEYYFLWAWSAADCGGSLSGYKNSGC